MTMTGGCVCGAVRYRTEAEPVMAGYCHCRDCQRTGGGGHVGFIGLPRAAVTVAGETRSYSLPAGSGRMTTRHFCAVCHSLVYGTSEVTGGMSLYAGTLDDPALFKPRIAIYVRSRPPWDDSSRGLPAFETVPPK